MIKIMQKQLIKALKANGEYIFILSSDNHFTNQHLKV